MSKERKNRVRIMKKLLELYNNGNPIKREYQIEKMDVPTVMILKAHGSLMNEAFPVSRDHDDNVCVSYYATIYPLTSSGEEYMNRGRYIRLKETTAFNVIRDGATAIGFILSILLTVMKACS